MYPIKKLHQFPSKSAFRKLIVNIEISFEFKKFILKKNNLLNDEINLQVAERKKFKGT